MCLTLYAMLPFINSLGCDYKSEAINDEVNYLTTCKMGLIKTVATNKVTGEKIIYEGLSAKKGNDMIFIAFNSSQVNTIKANNNDENIISLVDTKILSAKLIHTEHNDLIMIRSPSYYIYEVNITGKISFW